MNNILVVLPYHSADLEIARKLLEWIAEFGSCKPHSLLLCADSLVPQEKMRELMDIARPNFVNVKTMIATMPTIVAQGGRIWNPNIMFLRAAQQVHETTKFDFLWLEPDAIPIYAGWLDDISEEYAECPARFMGSIVKQVGQPGLPAEYLNGVAVYPNDAIEVFDKIASVNDSSQAFDIGSASVVVPRAQNTKLISHFYGEKDLPPIFVAEKKPDSPKNHVTLDFVPIGAAIFHRSKDGKLIDLLRERENLRIASLPKLDPKMQALPPSKDLHGKWDFKVDGKSVAESKTEVELTEIPVALAPTVDMLPTDAAVGALPQQATDKRGPGIPRKETVST